MKRIAVYVLVAAVALSIVSLGSDAFARTVPQGPDGKPIGSFCCVKDTCVVTKNEADCKKIGGKKVNKCEECGKAAKTK